MCQVRGEVRGPFPGAEYAEVVDLFGKRWKHGFPSISLIPSESRINRVCEDMRRGTWEMEVFCQGT